MFVCAAISKSTHAMTGDSLDMLRNAQTMRVQG